MKKVLITGLVLLSASTAFAQNTTINFPSSVSLSIGATSCLSGATYVTVNGSSISTDGTITATACGGATGQTASPVTVTLVPSTYLAGDTATADFPLVKWSSSDAGMSCSVPSPPAGFTVSSTTGSGSTGSITLTPPATAPTASNYVFAVTCGTTTTNAYASPASTSKTLTITSSTGTGGSTACASTQVSSAFTNGAVLTRQCTGNIYWGPYRAQATGVALQSVDAVFLGTWATGYTNNNAPFAPYLSAGQYISLAFTPTATTSYTTLVMNYMGSYGTNGVLSFSKTPGNFNPTDSSCLASGSNNLLGYTGPKYPGYCSIPADGSTYYVNFAPVDASGNPVSWKNITNPVPLNYYLTKQ